MMTCAALGYPPNGGSSRVTSKRKTTQTKVFARPKPLSHFRQEAKMTSIKARIEIIAIQISNTNIITICVCRPDRFSMRKLLKFTYLFRI